MILYREAFDEGDRLLVELDDLPVVLETIIADSDVWTYELMENGKLTAAFNSNPHYFGGDGQKLPRNGDPERLCQALGMEGHEAEIKRVQRRRALFADFPCRTFCRLIGAPAGSLHFNDLEVWNDGRSSPSEVGGWRIEPLFFERRKRYGEESRPLVLHSLAVRAFEPQAPRAPEIDPALAAQMHKQAQVINLTFKPLQWVSIGLGPLFTWWHRRRYSDPKRATTGDSFLDALAAVPRVPFGHDGDWLFNRRFGVRIRTSGPATGDAQRLFRIPHEVFRFTVNGVTVTALAIRPEKLRHSFTLRPSMSVLSDEKFFAGSYPARQLTLRVTQDQHTRFLQQWFIETETFAVIFDASSQQQLSPEDVSAISAVVQSFELISKP